MSSRALIFLATCVVFLAYAPSEVAAFGAGNIPSFSYIEGSAFRHGDIEDVVGEMVKSTAGGMMFLSKGTKFTPLDVKRLYFGNWLRDYSQAVDVGALKKAPLQTILNVVMALGFLAHGYVTGEFEVTKDRLGCYLPTEHIDNPKGYADGEDARQYDPRLRGPVDPRELEVDPHTGMKNYIANEGNSWDTSKSLVRRVLESCIHFGRQYKSTGNKADEYEAFRLLGQALHTLEDFTAHSNWCELSLQQFGHDQVFAHVGRNVRIQAPNGKSVPILVTGTFGGADFIHSLMGEATDHLSEASVSDLNKKVNSARSDPAGNNTMLRQMLFDLPGGGGDDLSREMDNVNQIRAAPGQGGQDPNTMSPQELYKTMWTVLSFRDSVMKKIENTIDRIPGLGSLVEKLTNSINVFVFTTLEPFLKPILASATGALGQGSAEVIKGHDQYEVFNDPNASDPTHSFLSKDHFGLVLNEPAGMVAQVVVRHTVQLVVQAWDDNSIPTHNITEDILSCLFHPAWYNQQSTVQRLMTERMRQWYDGLRNKNDTMNRLTEQSVKNHGNKRAGDQSSGNDHSHGSLPSGGLQGVLAQHNIHVPGSQVLNAGQDLMSGKMPWQQGFGSGGPQAWRGMDPNDAAAGAAAAQGYQTYDQNQNSGYGVQHQSQNYQGGGGNEGYPGSNEGYPGGGQQQQYGGGYNQGPPPGPPYGQEQYGGGQFGGPPPDQYGGYQGGPPGGYQQGPPGGYHQGGGYSQGGY